MGKTGGGFESLKLHYPLFKAIRVKGYKVPTPIQRKAIPPMLAGNDVIATARTGSGKTAAFLIPIIQKLEEHSHMVGVRAVIISPTRELAIQTCRFAVELSKFTDLRIALLTGGEGLKKEFEKLADNPDIVIATPGRLMHMVSELNFSLSAVQTVVLDEADRLVELGLFEQVQVVLKSMTLENRQTVLISASMPAVLADYTKTGLNNPILVKLDQERMMPETLTLKFYYARKDSKEALLLYLLRHVLDLTDTLTMVFVATKHHVEYLDLLLKAAGVQSAGLYGDLDQQVREETMDAFRKKRFTVLIVTDVAARGIDIPLLDYTVQYDFAANPRLFINRVGRVARAGKTGTSYSFVSNDELPYYLDTLLSIGKQESETVIGLVPESVIQLAFEELNVVKREKLSQDEVQLKAKSVQSALKVYYKTRQSASSESVRRAKELALKVHPDFSSYRSEDMDLKAQLKSYRPDLTILEVGAMLRGDQDGAHEMKRRRYQIGMKKTAIAAQTAAVASEEDQEDEEEVEVLISDHLKHGRDTDDAPPGPTKRRRGQLTSFRDPQFYVSNDSSHFFDKDSDLTQLSLSVPNEDELGFKLDKRKTKWSNLKKKYIRQDDDTGVVKTRKNSKATTLYHQWKGMTKKRIQRPGETEDTRMTREQPMAERFEGPKELKSRDELLKGRKKAEHMEKIHKKQQSSRPKTRRH